jgi:hypothetical protein
MPDAFKSPIDPTRFGDPLALKLDFRPSRPGGEGEKPASVYKVIDDNGANLR